MSLILTGRSKKSTSSEATELFQAIVFYYQNVGKGFKKKTRYVFPFYSKEVFLTKEEAENYIPVFLKSLVNDNNIDKNILSDQKLADEYIKTAVWPLKISKLEIMKDE